MTLRFKLYLEYFSFRIAQQQENARKFSRQPPPKIIPTPIVPPPQPSKPVDLTSSLLQSNLNQLTTKTTQPIPQPTKLNQTVPNYSLNMGNTASYGYPNTMPFDNQLALPPNTGWSGPTGNLSSSSANFNNKWANNQNNQTSMKQDWSAFESLLPNQSQSSTNNNNTVKKLSKSEMMDLLS